MSKRGRRDTDSASSASDDDANSFNVAPFLLSKYHHLDGYDSEDERQRAAAVRKRTLMRKVAASVLVFGESLIEAFCHYRGGLNAMRNFVVLPTTFDPRSMCDKAFVAMFRFEREEMAFIIRALKLPSEIVSAHRDKAPVFDVFCMMCAKFAFPKRFSDMLREFGKSCSGFRAPRTSTWRCGPVDLPVFPESPIVWPCFTCIPTLT